NVERQLENGLAPLDAAKAAMREVTGPIIATTAVLAAVFVPVAFLPGVTGRLYNQFALTIAISVAISAFNSLTLSPALCAVMLRHRVPSRFIPFRAFNAGFSRVMRTYANAIRHLIGARWLVLTLFAIGLALTYGLYTRVPTGFLPVEDQGYFFAVAQLPDGASLERTETVAEKIRSILAAEDGVQDVFNTLQIYLGSLYVNDFNLAGRTFHVTIQADQGARADATDISRLYVRNSSGGMVPLSTLGQLRPVVGPEFIPHYNLYGSARINGAAAPGYSSGQAIAAMQRAAATALPPGFSYEWTGITYQELKAGAVAGIVFALALVFVFLSLAAQYESWSMPFMVILAVPLALLGALAALWLRGMQIDVFSEIGFVMLIGLAAKNA